MLFREKGCCSSGSLFSFTRPLILRDSTHGVILSDSSESFNVATSLDSITQFALGAAVGEAVLGKKEGNRAILWGGIMGTLPDLDILLDVFQDGVDAFMAHRGLSHSFFFAIVVSPVIGYSLSVWKRKPDTAGGSSLEWITLVFLALVTHAILDTFTIYGTGLLEPLSAGRFAFPIIFIIDPVYSLPLVIGTIWCLFLKRGTRKRRRVILTALAVSSAYLLLCYGNKLVIESNVRNSLKDQDIAYQSFMTNPTPLNNILWYTVVKADSGFYYGLHSLLDDDRDIEFSYIPQNEYLLQDIEDQYVVQQLKRFSQNYYTVSTSGERRYLNDLRFGLIGDAEAPYLFSFPLEIVYSEDGPEVIFQEGTPDFSRVDDGIFYRLWRRILGDRNVRLQTL